VDILYDEIPTVRALREMDARQAASPITWKRTYWLVFMATGDEDLADKAAATIMAEEIRQAGSRR